MIANIERMQMLQSSGADIGETTLQEQTGKEEIETSKTSDELVKEAEKNKEQEDNKKEEQEKEK